MGARRFQNALALALRTFVKIACSSFTDGAHVVLEMWFSPLALRTFVLQVCNRFRDGGAFSTCLVRYSAAHIRCDISQ
eukprot:6856399-Pyramimonas_sp.AAC.1